MRWGGTEGRGRKGKRGNFSWDIKLKNKFNFLKKSIYSKYHCSLVIPDQGPLEVETEQDRATRR